MTYEESLITGTIIAASILYVIVMVCVIVLFVACNWKLFNKAGYAGWKALIPFYNTWIISQLSTGRGIYMLFMFIPFVNIVFAFWLSWMLVKSYGGGFLYYLGFLFLPIIFYPHMAFSSTMQYIGPFPGQDI